MLSLNRICVIMLSLLSFAAISCQKAYDTTASGDIPEDTLEISTKSQFNPYRISGDIELLEEADAMMVAMNQEYRNYEESKKEIRNVESVYTMYGNSGNPVLYAVNFAGNKGFTLVSATKKYYPILAETEKGNLESEEENCGIYEYLQDYKTVIDLCDMLVPPDEAARIRNLWARYENRVELEVMPETKASSEEEQRFWTVCNNWITTMENNGYEVYALYNYPDDISEDLFDTLCIYAQNNIDPSFLYSIHSFIAIDRTGSKYQVEPYVHITWGQDSPYRDYLPNGVTMGCSTVAMGQIMRYYEWPTTYSWSSMPYNTASNETKQFLYDLHYQTSDSNGFGYIDTVYVRFLDYGYLGTLEYYTFDNAKNSIIAGRPVYMRGDDIRYAIGHAWVCSGYKESDLELNVYLYVPQYVTPTKIIMRNVYSKYLDETCPPSLYMNWGLAGLYNGWFANSDVYIDLNPGYINYAQNRRMISNIRVNNQ